TCSTSPVKSVMYLPDEMGFARRTDTSAVFRRASVASMPRAMLENSSSAIVGFALAGVGVISEVLLFRVLAAAHPGERLLDGGGRLRDRRLGAREIQPPVRSVGPEIHERDRRRLLGGVRGERRVARRMHLEDVDRLAAEHHRPASRAVDEHRLMIVDVGDDLL